MARAYLTTGQPNAAGPGSTIIVEDRASAGAMAIHPCRASDRVLARVLAASLDARLAAGEPPESGRLLAARAQVIVSPGKRAELAGYWERLLDAARQPPRAPRQAVRLRREAIIAAAPAIGELSACLRAALPVSARGAAIAITLITSGGGPLYSSHALVRLEAVLRDAIRWLDPALPLLAAAGGGPDDQDPGA
jgi:hypothetical protein